MVTTRQKVRVIYELRHKFKVAELIKIANIPRSGYYYNLQKMDKPDKYEKMKREIFRIFHIENKCRRGYRIVTLELKKKHKINHKTVQWLMKGMNLICKVKRKKYQSFKGGTVGKIAPNLINRNFKATKLNEKWVADITEFNLFGKKLYLSPILDLYNSEIISYTLTDRPNSLAINKMLDKALEVLPQQHNLLIHSDQGWQYRMFEYQQKLKSININQSMSRKGNCLDNSVMENFFSILKSELLYLQKFNSIDHFVQELHEYMNYYNNRRIKQKLNGMNPVDYRNHLSQVA